MNKKECKVCIHRDTCTLDNPKNCEFEPIEKVEKYFSWGEFRPNSDLIHTMSVEVSDGNYRERLCPYCGDEMFTEVEYDRYDSIVHYHCLCDGALAERECAKKRLEIIREYNEKMRLLSDEYKDKLEFKSMEKIIDIKLKYEKDDLMSRRSTTLNGFYHLMEDDAGWFDDKVIKINEVL